MPCRCEIRREASLAAAFHARSTGKLSTSNQLDVVIDFDQLLRDPIHPSRLLPAYDSDDHLHPNDVGCSTMADAIDLSLFRDRDED